MGRLSGGPWRQGVAVTWMAGRPGASSRVVAQGWRPRALPPSRRAPSVVVRTTLAPGSRARPVVVVAEQDRVDRAEVGGGDGWPGQLSGAGAPAEAVAAAGGSKVGSVNNRHPSTSIRAVPTSTLTVCRGPLRDGELTVTGGTHPVQATM